MFISSTFLTHLCTWLIFTRAWCLKLVEAADQPLPLEAEVIHYHSSRFVKPFDLTSLFPAVNQDDYSHEFLIGKVKLIQPLAASPHFFSASFNVYSREDSSLDIRIKPTLHQVHLDSQLDQIKEAKYEFNLTQLSYPNTPFKTTRRTIIVVPGYMSSDNVNWVHAIRSKWLKLEDVNVITVYWPDGNSNLYATAVANTRIVSRQITILLYYLAEVNGINLNDRKFRESLQFVGHSIGAHVCGFVGQDLAGEVGRITGLDPAGPIFDKQEPEMRLDKNDAIFVDIIHTNAGRMRYVKAGLGVLKKVLRGVMSRVNFKKTSNLAISMLDSFHSDDDTAWFGLARTSGHMDYYPSGGSVQPGCNDQLHICDHKRATSLYVSVLDHEIHARHAYGAESDIVESGLHRLVAFPSQDYEQFQSGLALIRNCPLLLSSGSVYENKEMRIAAYKRCTVPLDFVTTGRAIRNELELDYDIPLAEDEAGERRYFFSTLSTEPFIGEHYLMRVHFAPDDSMKWTRGCKLTSLIHAYDSHNLYSQINYQPLKMFPHVTEDFDGISLPFASPVDWRVAHPTPKNLDEQLSTIAQLELDTDYLTSIRYFIPGNISLGISHTGEGKSILGNLGDMITLKRGSESSKCLLVISAVEIRPLFSMVFNVSSWYFNDAHDELALPVRLEEELHYLRKKKEFHLNLNISNPFAMIYPTIINFKKFPNI